MKYIYNIKIDLFQVSPVWVEYQEACYADGARCFDQDTIEGSVSRTSD